MSNSFYCNSCGSVNIYGQGWCIGCGQPFYYNCPQCGAYINNTNYNCPDCGMGLLWPDRQPLPAAPNAYEEYKPEKGMSRVLKGSLVLIGILIVLAASFFTINSLQKPAEDSLLAQSSQPSQPAQDTRSVGAIQLNDNSSSYYLPDNEFDSKNYTPPDNEFDSAK